MRATFKRTTKALLAISALLLLGTSASAQGKSVDVPFTFNHGEIILSVLVDGRPTNLILDTGAVDTSLNLGTAKTIGEQKSGRAADGKQISVEIGEAVIEVGGQKFRSQVLMMPKILDGCGGVLGQNILGLFSKVIVDYGHRVVTFEK
jgi:predicted aspartyl protease